MERWHHRAEEEVTPRHSGGRRGSVVPRTGFGVVTGNPGRKLVSMSDVTRLLDAAAAGDRPGRGRPAPARLRRAAQARRRADGGRAARAHAPADRPGPRGVPPARRPGRPARWDGRGHFFAAAAEAMRRILVEAARRKQADKRGGGIARRRLDPDHSPPPDRPTRPSRPGRGARPARGGRPPGRRARQAPVLRRADVPEAAAGAGPART